MTGQENPRVFLHELYWDARSRNTDWRYVRFEVPKLVQYEPDLTFTTERSRMVTLVGNVKAVGAAIGRRVGLHMSLESRISGRLSRSELARSRSNMIFGKIFPTNAGDTPVIWEAALIDRDMCRSYGMTQAALDEEFRVLSKFFYQARVVKVLSEVERRRHAEMFPDIADRFVTCPYFFPHIKGSDRDVLEKHINPEIIRILFVGNNAQRKGLDQLFDAFLQLAPSLQKRALLTVISNFDRSNITVPQHENIVVLHGAPRERVMQEMKTAHIFVNVARFESYGVVFHEAMSQGAACMGPDWEVQRELLDYGRAGMNVHCSGEAIRAGLERLIEDGEHRYSLASAGWARFQEHYTPAHIAGQFAAMFRSVS